ncbi:hypothetical protein [Pseudorhodoplanes sp.]|uniref:hypothetical protein n=1 Tax=Pseudorhodoplanes sp. TaxID=1934341 RepID=UPI003D0C5DFF
MFFAWLGRILAILILIFALFKIAVALAIASDVLGPYDAALARYFPSAKSTGQVIDKGVYAVILSIALGILAEIRFTLRDKVMS